MKKIFALIIILLIFGCRTKNETTQFAPELEKLIKQKDTVNLRNYHRKFDVDFASDWKLNEVESRVEIDHFIFGYNFEWVKKKSDTIIYRNYTFDIDGNFHAASEQRELNDKLVSRGGIEIENETIKYIRQVYPKAIEPEFEVGYYEFEVFENGKIVAIYRADHLNHFYKLTEKQNKDEIELIYGIDYLNIKK
jgi:hypothetical protein